MCARFADQVQYSSAQYVVEDLFGTRSLPGSIHLPTHLDHLISMLPPGHHYTADQLIDEYTLFPFYEPFLPPESSIEIRKSMHQNTGRAIHATLGKAADQQIWPEHLRLCLLCVQEDRQRFGKCYWHRLHQILGVEVCPLHNCYLSNSKISSSNELRSYTLVTAEQAIGEVEPVPLDGAEEKAFELLLSIARQAHWLLNQGVEVSELGALIQRYRNLLIEQGMATYRGSIRIPALTERFRNYYTPQFLRHLHSEVSERGSRNWLVYLLKSHSREHPLRHLLLLQCLGSTAETFFTGPAETPPFGKGPWPCLNPVCRYYLQPCIESCLVTYSWSPKQREGRPKGVFTCTCGFAYMRIGPDQSDADRLCLSRVKAYGPVWEAAFRRLWADSSCDLKAVAKQLSIGLNSVKFHAARLGLTFPRPGGWLASPEKHLPHPRCIGIIDPETRERYRKAWLAVREAHPGAGTRFLMNQVKAVYEWLRKHDNDWLKAHQPARNPRTLPLRLQRNWGERDARLAAEVEEAALRLMKSSGSPIRITRTAIAAEIGQSKKVLSGALEKLPMTQKTLMY